MYFMKILNLFWEFESFLNFEKKLKIFEILWNFVGIRYRVCDIGLGSDVGYAI